MTHPLATADAVESFANLGLLGQYERIVQTARAKGEAAKSAPPLPMPDGSEQKM